MYKEEIKEKKMQVSCRKKYIRSDQVLCEKFFHEQFQCNSMLLVYRWNFLFFVICIQMKKNCILKMFLFFFYNKIKLFDKYFAEYSHINVNFKISQKVFSSFCTLLWYIMIYMKCLKRNVILIPSRINFL